MTRLILGSMVGMLLFLSCDSKSAYHEYQSVAGKWTKADTVQFEFPPLDSVATQDLFITLRANHQYPYSNLFLITNLEHPNGKVLTDTLEYAMAQPDGTLLGEGIGDIKESKLWYKEGFRFRESGIYTLSITHAMRANGSPYGDEELEGIMDVGVRIEKPIE